MRSRMAAVLLALCLVTPSFAEDKTVLEGPRKEIDSILALFAEWARARDAGDVEGVVAVYHPEMRIMTRNKAIFEGADGVRAFYRQNYSETSRRKLYSSVSELRVFGDAAIVVGRFLASDPEKGVEDPGYYLIVLRKDRKGSWRIYRDIDTPSPDGLALKPHD